MAKSSPPHSTLPSYARIKARDLTSTTAAATFSKVRLPTATFLFAVSYERSLYLWKTEEHSKSGTLPSAARRKKKTKEDKPLTLLEQRLTPALDAPTSSRSASPSAPSPLPPTHAEEQAALRAETIAEFHTSTAADDIDGEVAKQEEGSLFTLREKTRDEVEREEAEYRAYLEREVGPLENKIS